MNEARQMAQCPTSAVFRVVPEESFFLVRSGSQQGGIVFARAVDIGAGATPDGHVRECTIDPLKPIKTTNPFHSRSHLDVLRAI